MKYIETTTKIIYRSRNHGVRAKEITSFDEVKLLKHGNPVAVMYNFEMVSGKIQTINDDYALIWDGVDMITVQPCDFKYRNYMYELFPEGFL